MSSTSNPSVTSKPTKKPAAMDKTVLFLQLVSKIPLMARVALLHMLQTSPASKYQDLRTELIIAMLRSFIDVPKPKSITSTQKILSTAPPISGTIWVSKYTLPIPTEEDARAIHDTLNKVIDGLQDRDQPKTARIQLPEVLPVEAEWTAHRPGVPKDAKLPDIPEREKYDEMMKDVKTPTTVLYFHGGAYWLMDPATHRPTCRELAKRTGGRCYSVRYRLAPQNPFPAAVMDALVSYLGLLYPPADAFHEAVKPEHIVIAGDSAGGNLSLALLQLIMQLQRSGTTVSWLGEERSVPLPAGVAVNSPWMDITHSSPSCVTNAPFDYLPSIEVQEKSEKGRDPCSAWPANPPRMSIYVADDYIMHPLVSLLLAPSWRGAPPTYICTGWEILADEDKFTAARFHAEGVSVTFEEYEGMPHCFAMLLKNLREADRCMEGWSRFIARVTKPTASEGGFDGDDDKQKSTTRSTFTTIKSGTLEEKKLDPTTLSPYTEEEIREKIRRRVELKCVPATEGDVAKL
ncbi:alpha/beta hydrolase fold-domain-containing protein [Neurospora tetraspora]|uniref:Alpha/beta hydrolase fold-domain-containing protein n=1 Tax=Neurospora tetraspora TaxID=94610 RepID=A0AAE0JED9_9PEZI|nr:alpha/beta hydrolase fold-domain-containing protein [Neurospora tetraspora]